MLNYNNFLNHEIINIGYENFRLLTEKPLEVKEIAQADRPNTEEYYFILDTGKIDIGFVHQNKIIPLDNFNYFKIFD